MKEILFRGYSSTQRQWVYGDLLHTTDRKTHISNEQSFIGVNPETVGQFTGLIDKNGTKVFEGDVLKGAWKTILTIFYDEITLSYRVKTSVGYDREPSYYGIEKLEVIGNIYDNPELMKSEV